jgi:hypothetical protein
VRAVVKSAEAQDYRFSAIVAGVVRSPAFRRQGVPELTSVQASLGSAGATSLAE